MSPENLFEKVGACRLSKSGEALNIHLIETNEYLSIPLTDIKAIILEQLVNSNKCPMPTIGTVRKYNVKPKLDIVTEAQRIAKKGDFVPLKNKK